MPHQRNFSPLSERSEFHVATSLAVTPHGLGEKADSSLFVYGRVAASGFTGIHSLRHGSFNLAYDRGYSDPILHPLAKIGG